MSEDETLSQGTLSGRLFLVTGGASGIGRAAVERLAARGAGVIVVDQDGERGKEVAQATGAGFIEADVASETDWGRVAQSLKGLNEKLSGAFLCAGLPTASVGDELGGGLFDLSKLDTKAYRKVIDVNVDGVVFGARALIPFLAADGGGNLVMMSSMAGIIGFAADPIYSMSKLAVLGLARSLVAGLAPRGVRVNAICPGLVDSGFLPESTRKRLKESGRGFLDPKDVGELVAMAFEEAWDGQMLICRAGSQSVRQPLIQRSSPGGAAGRGDA